MPVATIVHRVAFATLAAVSAWTSVTTAQIAPPHYVDVYGYFTTDAQYEAWYTLTTQLRRNFDDICGDTFCEDDYSNIEPLSYRCSVEQTSGRIGRCVWVFAGSYADIDPDSGRIDVTARNWRCRTPLAPRTSIDDLLAALAGDDPLDTPLPDTQTTIYDGLIHCL